jgi:hypothetical protein
MGLFGKIGKLLTPDPMAPRIYHCDPLLIVHPDDGIVFHGPMEVEFTPSKPDGSEGHARCLAPAVEAWQPDLTVQVRYNTYFNPDPDVRTRGGFSWMGIDETGQPFTWYVNRYADDYIVALNQGQMPSEINPGELEEAGLEYQPPEERP